MNTDLPTLPETATQHHGALRRTGVSTAALEFTVPAHELNVFGQLPRRVRDEVNQWLNILATVAKAKTVSAGCREVEFLCQFDADSTRRKFYQFAKDGWRALVDCAKAKVSREWLFDQSVGVVTDKLSDEFVQWFIALAERNQRKTRPAYREFVKRWQRGEQIPGLDNSQPRSALPKGCTYGNLNRKVADKFALKAMRQGLGAAYKHAPKVFSTRVGLWPMSHVMIDDLWHDNFVIFKGQIVRVLEFDALEVFSGCKIGWGTKPRLKREDGTHEGLQEKFVRMLLAQIFFQHGFSPTGTTLLAEHGTAAVREDLERLLYDRTGGKILVRRSGITGREQAVAGMALGQGKGNPRFKSALESLRNLIHNELAALPGQTGKDRDHAPEATAGEVKQHEDLLKAVAVLNERNPERAALIKMRLLEYHAHFLPLLAEVYETINQRTWHELEGWAKCGHIVAELNDAGLWTDANAIVPAKREALLALAQVDKTYLRQRQLSPREVFNRGAGTLTKLPAFVVAEMLGDDFAREIYCRDSYFEFCDAELDSEEMLFEGRIVTPEGRERELEADKYQVFVNPFDLNQLFVHDAKGRHLGIAPRVQRVNRVDEAQLRSAFGRANQRLADKLKPVRERHAEMTREATATAKHNARVLSGAPVTATEQENAKLVRKEGAAAAADVLAETTSEPSAPTGEAPIDLLTALGGSEG